MKPYIRSLKPGLQVWALVEECLPKNDVIINYSGDLIRIRNESRRTLRVGERVQLRVTGIQPLQFKLLSVGTEKPKPVSIDLTA